MEATGIYTMPVYHALMEPLPTARSATHAASPPALLGTRIIRLAALDQRIAIRARLDPMTREETTGYIKHHLALSGRTDTLFSEDAITLIHQTGRGLPRTTNNLAVNALIAAYAAGNAIVDHNAARTAITEITATP